MKKLIIIDDEPLARSIVREYLSKHTDIEIAAECGNGFDGVKAIQQHQPDLVLLDIQMPRINGFEMLELIDDPPAVIFATAFDEYAIKAFEASAVDYLLKPYSQDRFDRAIEKWKRSSGKDPSAHHGNLRNLLSMNRQPEEQTRIVVRTNSEISIVPAEKIQYIEAFDDYVKIFTSDDYFLKKRTMNYYEQVLNPSEFFRVHRSFIINIKEMTRIEQMEKNSYVVLLRSGKRIPLSRTAYVRLKSRLGI